jgi:hypothetical protein
MLCGGLNKTKGKLFWLSFRPLNPAAPPRRMFDERDIDGVSSEQGAT